MDPPQKDNWHNGRQSKGSIVIMDPPPKKK